METATEIKLKLNDVYSFRFNDAETQKRFEPYHCFDGTLIVREVGGQLILEDTYWGSLYNKTFTLERALNTGHLSFICNLDEVEKTSNEDYKYLDDSDLITLYIHHGCRNQYYKRRGAKRSQVKMLETVKKIIADAEYKKQWAERDIKQLTETMIKIEAGQTDVYL